MGEAGELGRTCGVGLPLKVSCWEARDVCPLGKGWPGNWGKQEENFCFPALPKDPQFHIKFYYFYNL